MAKETNKMMLVEADIAEAQKALDASQEEFLDPEKIRANVVGMGIGVKWKKEYPAIQVGAWEVY